MHVVGDAFKGYLCSAFLPTKLDLFLLFIKKEIGHLQDMNLSLNEEPMNRSIYLYIR